ncbi:MAG: DUF5674 family protein [Candidatus Omnitrophota bacterium]
MKIFVIGENKTEKINRSQLKDIAAEFGSFVKAVVDVEKCVMAIGGELHSDEEGSLLEKGSQQRHLWGVNLYPELQGDDFIEFDSMINLRPAHGNRTRGVDDAQIREKIREIISNLISS